MEPTPSPDESREPPPVVVRPHRRSDDDDRTVHAHRRESDTSAAGRWWNGRMGWAQLGAAGVVCGAMIYLMMDKSDDCKKQRESAERREANQADERKTTLETIARQHELAYAKIDALVNEIRADRQELQKAQNEARLNRQTMQIAVNEFKLLAIELKDHLKKIAPGDTEVVAPIPRAKDDPPDPKN